MIMMYECGIFAVTERHVGIVREGIVSVGAIYIRIFNFSSLLHPWTGKAHSYLFTTAKMWRVRIPDAKLGHTGQADALPDDQTERAW